MSISWLLFKKSGRQSIGRLSLTVGAIGLGVLLLLGFMAGVNGLVERANNAQERLVGSPASSYTDKASQEAQRPIEGVAPLKIAVFVERGNLSRWHDRSISVISLHKTGANSPEFSGMKTPEDGEYYLSPGLDRIARENPDANIGARYGTTYLGVMPREYAKSPDSLSVIRGVSGEVAAADKSYANFYTTTPTSSPDAMTIDPVTQAILTFGGAILLFPIAVLVSVATQLGSTQREQRYAALRLIGATRSQVNRVLLLESFVATIVGIVFGLLAFFALGGAVLHTVSFGGERFWPEDLSIHAWQYVFIVLMTLGLCLFANWSAMRKVRTSPLGVVRRAKPDKKPVAWRLIPLVVGVALFAWVSTPSGMAWFEEQDPMYSSSLLMGGIMLVMFGLVLAGSWLTGMVSGLIAKVTGRATALIATKRISGHSRQTFRSVSGVVLALFAGSFYLAVTSGVDTLETRSVEDNGFARLRENTVITWGDLQGVNVEQIKKQPFVSSAIAGYQDGDGYSLISCQDLPSYTTYTCPANYSKEAYARIKFTAQPSNQLEVVESPVLTERAPSYLINIRNSGDIELLRTYLSLNLPQLSIVWMQSGEFARRPYINPVIKDLAAVTYMGIGVTLFVAVVSLIVSTIGGIFERRRSLFTLRIGGMTLRQIKRVVMVESLIPLLSASVVAAGTGVWVAKVFLEAFSTTVRISLSPMYFVIVVGSLIVAAGSIWLVLSLLGRITSLEQNQTE